MKRFIYTLLLTLPLAWSCDEQEVEPVDPPTNNPKVTITPAGDYSSVAEGDVLVYTISVDKMIQSPLSFSVELSDAATGDEDDFEVEGGTLQAFSNSTTIQILVTPDHVQDDGEVLAFRVVPDFHWDWQINPDFDNETPASTVKDLTYTLDWSAGSHEGSDLCEWAVDLDVYLLNASATAGDFGGATGACPVEAGNVGGLPEDTYDIYVMYYDSEIDGGANVSIPYVVTFTNSSGGVYTIEGEFSSDDAKETEHRVGHVVVSGGTYTLFDESGTEIGPL